MGHRVLCITPDVQAVRSWIEEQHSHLSPNIFYFPYDMKQVTFPTEGGLRKLLLAKIKLWRAYASIVRKAGAHFKCKIDLVFFNWLDTMVLNYLHPVFIAPFFRYKFSGIYFHPKLLRLAPEVLQERATVSGIDIVLTSNNCVGVAMHDEGIISGQSYRLNGKKVLLFPEIADDATPDVNHPVYKEIKERAKGRIVVGTLGLEWHKGAGEMMQLAKRMDPDNYFFAFTGPFENSYLDHFPSDIAKELKLFLHHPLENVFVKTGNLEEGTEYNSVFAAFDIVYIVYKNFPSASNRLTKAAQLHRLVIADEKYCVGEDVRHYNLGATVNGDDISSIEQGIKSLRDRIVKQDFPYEYWKRYATRNSVDVLEERFRELLDLV